MTVGMRGFEERFGVYFVDIPSQCLHTRSTLGDALEDLRRGSLRVYLNCLAKVIEQLLCSSTTSSTSFSWRLPRGLYLLEEGSRISSSSTGEKAEKKVVFLPMKVLDDLSICEQRAILRAESRLSSKPTVHQELGKEWWNKRREKYSKLIESVLRGRGEVYDRWLEHPIGLAHEDSTMQINLSGLVDMIFFYSASCGDEYKPLILLFEFTLHREIGDVATRVTAYSSVIYTKYGFPTIPVIVVMKSINEDIVEKMVLLMNTNRLGISQISVKMKRLEELLSGNVKPRYAPHEICLWCDTELRRRCEHYL